MSLVGFWRRRPTYTWIAMPTSINEGGTGTYSINTTYVAAGATLYWRINNGSTSNADFSLASGSFTVSNNIGSFNIGPIADLTTEGSESFTISISQTSGGTPVLTSGTITVGDTSQTPTAAPSALPSPSTGCVIEGVQLIGLNGPITSGVASITGSTTGSTVWGDNSYGYTSDSDFATAAVHAGLLSNGQTGNVRFTNLGSLPGPFPGTTANGVTTSPYPASWCTVILSNA